MPWQEPSRRAPPAPRHAPLTNPGTPQPPSTTTRPTEEAIQTGYSLPGTRRGIDCPDPDGPCIARNQTGHPSPKLKRNIQRPDPGGQSSPGSRRRTHRPGAITAGCPESDPTIVALRRFRIAPSAVEQAGDRHVAQHIHPRTRPGDDPVHRQQQRQRHRHHFRRQARRT